MRMRWARHVTCIGEMRIVNRVLFGKLEERLLCRLRHSDGSTCYMLGHEASTPLTYALIATRFNRIYPKIKIILPSSRLLNLMQCIFHMKVVWLLGPQLLHKIALSHRTNEHTFPLMEGRCPVYRMFFVIRHFNVCITCLLQTGIAQSV
jgi:hypothetical protein